MLRPLILAVSLMLAALIQAAPAPLAVKDIGLMLRTGYSNQAVVQELSKRRFSDTVDAAKETQLIRAGASPELLLALRNGTYTVSAEEAAQLKQQKEIEAKRHVAAAEEARKFNTLHQAQLAQDRAANAVRQQLDGHGIYEQLKGDLVQWHGGAVSRFEDSGLEKKKYFLIYFSAHWCGPCRKFTPGLINFYNDTIAKHPEFELIFVSCDKSPFGMETYMRETGMPWPAIDFQKVRQKDGIQKYAGKGIPDLVLVDSSGKVLADSYKGEQYLGPESVLQALNGVLTNGTGSQVAQAR